jgi:hypothetical protein
MGPAPACAIGGPLDRHPIVSFLMLIGGILMLLPGACVLILVDMGGWPKYSLGPFPAELFLYGLWPICFAISALGVYLLVKVIRDV